MSITVTGRRDYDRADEILTPQALAWVETLPQRFATVRDDLLAARVTARQAAAESGTMDFLPETREVRNSDWRVAPAPEKLRDRRAEITGPVAPAKMAINALNSGAKVWLADLEDASAPFWRNVIESQVNLYDATRGTLSFTAPEGKSYTLRPTQELATVVVRPRGLHLSEKNIEVDGQRAIGSFVDFGLHFFHNAAELHATGDGPFYYLPKLEHYLEARLWNDIFTFAEQELNLDHGIVRATVLIETIPAAFQMDEILYELRDHASGLNAGRWDYLFSIIKTFREAGEKFVLPDRADVSMTAPMMRAYTDLLVKTCHRRGAFAVGGMAAFIPNRHQPETNEIAMGKVRADKQREAEDGFDGSWVAHPDLVPICVSEFDKVLGGKHNQVDRQRDDVTVTAADLLDVESAPGRITEEGVRNNLYVAVAYTAVWPSGNGAVAIRSLMEDAATAEISRSQVWQLIANNVTTVDTGEIMTAARAAAILGEEVERRRNEVDDADTFSRYYQPAADIIARITTGREQHLVDLLT